MVLRQASSNSALNLLINSVEGEGEGNREITESLQWLQELMLFLSQGIKYIRITFAGSPVSQQSSLDSLAKNSWLVLYDLSPTSPSQSHVTPFSLCSPPTRSHPQFLEQGMNFTQPWTLNPHSQDLALLPSLRVDL